MKRKFISTSPQQTEDIAASIGKSLQGGECIEFISDVGGGKTTFVRGLAAGAGSVSAVSSPTFTISQRYDAGSITIYHFDFYRLQEPGLGAEELAEVVHDDTAVVVVEWAETVENVLPENRVVITIEKYSNDDQLRKFTIDIPDEYSYLVSGEGGVS